MFMTWMMEGTPDAMNLQYADPSLPDLLGKPSLHYAAQAFAVQTVPPLCSNMSTSYSTAFSKSWFYGVMTNITYGHKHFNKD